MKKNIKKAIIFLLAVLVAVQISFTSSLASESVATDDERATQTQVGFDSMSVVTADMLNDGTYEIEVDSSSSMFRIVEASLTVENGDMNALITLGGTGYLKLYMGTGEMAVNASEDEYSNYVEDENGAYTYSIHVDSLNTELECTGYSKRKEKWYDHQICFLANTLPLSAFKDETIGNTIINETEEDEETSESTDNTSDDSTSSESVTYDEIALENGTYTVDVVLEGGSGKASVDSPASLTISDENTVTIRFSSPNYDYVIFAGEKYLPTNAEGNSTFELPFLVQDGKMEIVADTTAMSTPHEIEYDLVFDLSSISADTSFDVDITKSVEVIAALIVIAIVCAFIGSKYGKEKEN